MTAHLRRPDLAPAPPELQLFLAERRFAQDFHVPALPLREWPVRKLQLYMVIMQAIDQHEADRQQAGNNPAAAARAPKPASLDHLRAGAKPPPMPPP